MTIGRDHTLKALAVHESRLQSLFEHDVVMLIGGFTYVNLRADISLDKLGRLVEQGLPFNYYPTDLSKSIIYTRFNEDGTTTVTENLLGEYILIPEELIDLTAAQLFDKVQEHAASIKEPSWDDQEDLGYLYTIKKFME